MHRQFTLHDYIAQALRVQELGPTGKLIGLLPGMSDMMNQIKMTQADLQYAAGQTRSIYQAMTPAQQDAPDDLTAEDRQQIAARAGVSTADVTRLLNDFKQSRKMMQTVWDMQPGDAPPSRTSSWLGHLQQVHPRPFVPLQSATPS